MEIKKKNIEGLIELIPNIYFDSRGLFFESFNAAVLTKAGINLDIVQDNQSFSKKGVIRGLHFQQTPYEQGKLVRVISGKVLDVAVDLRKNSPTFGQHYSCILEAELNNMLYVPPGFAHGFSALEDSIFFYKCTAYYNKFSESGILWNDPELNIDWKVKNPIVSEKDQMLNTFDFYKKSL